MVVEGCRDCLLHLNNIFVTDPVQFIGGDAGFDMGFDHFKYFGSKASCYAHFFNLVGGFNVYAHATQSVDSPLDCSPLADNWPVLPVPCVAAVSRADTDLPLVCSGD